MDQWIIITGQGALSLTRLDTLPSIFIFEMHVRPTFPITIRSTSSLAAKSISPCVNLVCSWRLYFNELHISTHDVNRCHLRSRRKWYYDSTKHYRYNNEYYSRQSTLQRDWQHHGKWKIAITNNLAEMTVLCFTLEQGTKQAQRSYRLPRIMIASL